MAKKVFENQVDHSIVELDSDEKESLKSQLEEANKKLQGKISLDTDRHRSNTTSLPPKKVPFLKMLWNFIMSLVFNIPFRKDANISVARIHEIKKILNGLGIDFYDFKSNAVKSEFALYMLDIYRGVRAAYEIYTNPKTEFLRDCFMQYFFDFLLSPQSRQIKNDMAKENIEKVFYNEEVKDKREYIKEKQGLFTDSVKQYDSKTLQTALMPLDQLIQIYNEFDFRGFFENFGTFKNNQLEIAFSKVEPDKVMLYLKDIGALMKLITEDNLSAETEKAIKYANQEIRSKGYKESVDFLPAELINKTLMMARKLLKFNIVDSMTQYIAMDEREISGYAHPKRMLYSRYINWIVTESIKNYNQLEDEKSKEFLIKDILIFFGVHSENDLITSGIYTIQTKHFLEAFDIKVMDYIKPLSILLTFLKKYYEGIVRSILNTIVVKGSFVKKIEGEDFSALYYKYDEQITQLQNFINEELTPSDLAKKPIVEIIMSGKELTPVERKNIKEKISRADKMIGESIDHLVEEFYKIYVYLKKFLEDFKKTYPEAISNIRNLKTESGHSLHSALENAISIIEKYFSIMRNYVVIKGELNDSFKKLDQLGK